MGRGGRGEERGLRMRQTANRKVDPTRKVNKRERHYAERREEKSSKREKRKVRKRRRHHRDREKKIK